MGRHALAAAVATVVVWLHLGVAAGTQAPAPHDATGALTTGFLDDSSWCSGPYLDLTAAAASAVTVTGFQMYFHGAMQRDVSVYWKAGTYAGSETTPDAWTLLGTVSVTPPVDSVSGALLPVALGGVVIPAGQTYGFKVWDTGIGLDLRLGGTFVSDEFLTLASTRWTCFEVFGGLSPPDVLSGWQGHVLYTPGVVVPTMGTVSVVTLFVLLSAAGWLRLRRLRTT